MEKALKIRMVMVLFWSGLQMMTQVAQGYYVDAKSGDQLVARELPGVGGFCVAIQSASSPKPQLIAGGPISEELLRRSLRVQEYWAHAVWGSAGSVLANLVITPMLIENMSRGKLVSSGLLFAMQATIISAMIGVDFAAAVIDGEDAASAFAVAAPRLGTLLPFPIGLISYLLVPDLVAERGVRGLRTKNLLSETPFTIESKRFVRTIKHLKEIPLFHGDCSQAFQVAQDVNR